MKDPLIITEADKVNQVWTKLVAHWEARLAELRAQNDGNHDEQKTADLRGRIAEIKAMLAYGKQQPIID